jgi:ankyrin repeat protein
VSILHIAARKQNASLLSSILSSAGIGTEEAPNWDFMTLDFLSLESDVEMIEPSPQVTAGIDLNPIDANGFTPFLLAVETGMTENIDILMNSDGVNLNAKDKYGRTAIHIAALQGRLDIVASLLASRRVDVNARDREGFTALHLAVRNEKAELVKFLLSSDQIDVNARDNENSAPLHFAAQTGNTAIGEMLLSRDETDVNCVNVRFLFRKKFPFNFSSIPIGTRIKRRKHGILQDIAQTPSNPGELS